MNQQGIIHVIQSIEKELENLKKHVGLPMDTGEEESYPDEEAAEIGTKTVGRGRKQRSVPTLGDGSFGKKPNADEEE